jgi:hypothetical protein
VILVDQEDGQTVQDDVSYCGTIEMEFESERTSPFVGFEESTKQLVFFGCSRVICYEGHPHFPISTVRIWKWRVWKLSCAAGWQGPHSIGPFQYEKYELTIISFLLVYYTTKNWMVENT